MLRSTDTLSFRYSGSVLETIASDNPIRAGGCIAWLAGIKVQGGILLQFPMFQTNQQLVVGEVRTSR